MFSRLLSLTLAGAASWMILYGWPVIGYKYQQADRHTLIMVVIGIIGSVMHGIGLVPGNIIFRLVFRWVARALIVSPLFM